MNDEAEPTTPRAGVAATPDAEATVRRAKDTLARFKRNNKEFFLTPFKVMKVDLVSPIHTPYLDEMGVPEPTRMLLAAAREALTEEEYAEVENEGFEAILRKLKEAGMGRPLYEDFALALEPIIKEMDGDSKVKGELVALHDLVLGEDEPPTTPIRTKGVRAVKTVAKKNTPIIQRRRRMTTNTNTGWERVHPPGGGRPFMRKIEF